MDENVYTAIVNEKIDTVALYEWARHPQSGAIVTFSGITRDSFEGKHVSMLSYDCYIPKAEKTLHGIASKSLSEGVNKVAIVHRIGHVPLSEESIFIVVSSAHRQKGWKTSENILEEVKRSTEIWKREVYEDNSTQWVSGIPVEQSK